MATTEEPSREHIYVLPNAKSESERLDSQHVLLTRTFGGLNLSPLDPSKLHHALDIGCGTGSWASDFAKQHANTEVIGFDIEEKPGLKTEPPNFTFKVADLGDEAAWSQLGKFDYIHGRFIVPSVRDWPKMLKHCFEHLNPGGWIEFQEFHVPFRSEDENKDGQQPRIIEWSNLMNESGAKVGLDMAMHEKFPQYLSDTGFAQVRIEYFKMMTSPYGEDEESKELGRMGQKNIATGLYGFTETLFTKVLGWSIAEYERYIQTIIDEVLEGKFRTYLPVLVHFAQRPE